MQADFGLHGCDNPTGIFPFN